MTTRSLTKVFNDKFEEKLKKQIPHHQAYNEAEEEFELEFHHRKYSSFESFRISRSKTFKSRKRN